jgi:two-component system, sensor histidine kinase and response regulator
MYCADEQKSPVGQNQISKILMSDRPSILVIDDEPNNFDVIQTLLGNEGYTFHYASSGQRAIDRLDRIQPDTILLDVMMPDLDGIEVCRRIRASIEWQAVPILLVTALTDKSELQRCLSTGADGFITKPVNRLELQSRVASIVRLKRECDRLQIAKEKLELATKDRSDRLAMFAYEIQTPLTELMSLIRVLTTTELTPEQDRCASKIQFNSELLLAQIDKIFAVSNIELNAPKLDLG